MPSQAHYNNQRPPNQRQLSRTGTITRAPARLQHSITHSLRRRGKNNGRDYSPINPVLKYLLFALNMLFMLLGGAVAGMCIYILVEKDKIITSFIEFIFDPTCLFTLIGCVTFVVAFFGFFGALRENVCCLKVYHHSLSFLLFLEILVIIFFVIFYFKEETLADIGLYPERAFEDAIEKYRDDPDMQDFIDNMHDVLSCCGASNDNEGYLNWNANRYFNCSSENRSPERCSVPFSCCRISEGEQINYQCGADMMDSTKVVNPGDTIYTRGCLKALKVILTDNIWLVCGVIPGIFIPQMIFICFAKALVSQIYEQMAKWY